MIFLDSLSENDKGLCTSGLRMGRFATYGADGCSPVLELSQNSAAELSSSRNNQTPRRKLSLCSTSSTPGVLPGSVTASDTRLQTPDSRGPKFRALNFSTEESPYLQYRAGHRCIKDVDSQQTNESSPRKTTRCSKRSREIASPNRSEESKSAKDERTRRTNNHLSDLQQIPGCSPLLPSPVEDAPLDAIPEVTLHFDRQLVHTGLAATRVFPRIPPEEPTSFSTEPQYAFSSTPIHTQTGRTFSPFSIPFRLSDASPGACSSKFSQLTPETHKQRNTAYGLDFNRDRVAFEHARRNLFEAYVPKPFGAPTTSACSDDDSPPADVALRIQTPSSGYVSMTSASSVLSSSGSSGSTPFSIVEQMECAKGEEFTGDDEGRARNSEDIEEESLVLAVEDRMRPVDNESGEPVDLESGEPVDIESNEPVDFGSGEGEPADHEIIEPVDIENFGKELVLQGLGCGGEQPSLIGDFSRPYTLPLVRGRNQDLKAISPDTMAGIVVGSYDDIIDFYQIIDCRYPYEFRGGHVKGARNICEEEDLVREFFKDSALRSHFEPTKKAILVFHCEFSSERAPKLLRFLRKTDRDFNTYPFLCYPEAYILEGGYKLFFESHPRLCEPPSYVPMLHSNYSDDLKRFRSKSRTYQDEHGKRLLKKRCANMNHC